MPWSETNKMDARFAAIKEFNTGNFTKTELCELCGISRPTLDKWLNRFYENGWNGLTDLSSKPYHSPYKVSKEIENIILSINEKKSWGNKKIHGHLELKYPGIEIPSASTIHNILHRHNRTGTYKRTKRWMHPGKPVYETLKPHDVLSADYKGEFRMRNRKKCYPLTITCNYSRYILGTFAHSKINFSDCRRDFEKVFKEYGLPRAILTDNGTPFSSVAICGISYLNVWWTELGIEHLLTEPSSPSQNGKHERMHRELKRLVTQPPGKDFKDQRSKLDEFRIDYNENLKHGGLDNATPKSVYEKSKNEYPEKIKRPEYPDNFHVRKVKKHGSFNWKFKEISISKPLQRKYLGFEEIDNGLFKVWFYNKPLGYFDEKTYKLEDKPGRFSRRGV